ncbi:NADPH:quinone reductase [Pseudomonas koreensis]|uniref:zinc-dependent alcohol dehydrogenase family protein n=1 Tax=Pseudomonas koreensis TaxID=198620 RepID=UPI00087DDB27|nr:zinc-dependent alcohol dehydrogenase family protein [Pseudomonas koreensis]KAB0513198.1 zinc-dependent alcohol dehydrogenase family protein [Pseudomonas koreensis]NNA63866.1 zinc-dependent alcohol dehydrogenase family protein [Pseudomonas koreensis]GGK37888.1 quinone oxidoreductase [Pseudomonas koreensis]SDE31621.1 NADPH:quinone reductase [Pseudomonas koreensis]
MSPSTIRALILDDYAANTFREAQIERPVPKANEVLVRIVASGVNPIDYKIRTGNAPYAMPELPAILGTDMAGVIEAVGANVSHLAVGDEVFGMVGGVRGLPGSLAEYLAVDADLVALKPKNLSFREAAAVPLVFLTAWEGLVDRAHVQAGQKVLVHGGAGGVGHMAVQIAAALGAEVFATVSPGKRAIVEGYGATAIDYKNVPVEQYVSQFTDGKGFDVVYDTVGGKSLDDSFAAIRLYGHVTSCAAFGTHNLATGSLRSATLSGIFVLLPMLTGVGRKHHAQILGYATRLIEEGKVKPLLHAERFSLSQARQAHDAVQQGTAIGKVVIDVA